MCIRDRLKHRFQPDLVMIGSGSLRKEFIGPIITAGDLMNMYSFDEKLVQITEILFIYGGDSIIISHSDTLVIV